MSQTLQTFREGCEAWRKLGYDRNIPGRTYAYYSLSCRYGLAKIKRHFDAIKAALDGVERKCYGGL